MAKKFFDFGGELGLPKVVEIEPTDACNLQCRMCHVSYRAKGARTHINRKLLEQLRPLEGTLISLGSSFEPMMHPEFSEILSMLRDFGFRLDMVTNGTLLNDKIVGQMRECDFGRLSFSFDGIKKETYEYIRRNSDYDRTIANITNARKAFTNKDTFFMINNVIMRCNIDELIEGIDFWDAESFDRMNCMFMVLREKNDWLWNQSLYSIRPYAYRRLDEAARHVIEKKKRLMIGCAYYSKSALKTTCPDNLADGLVFSDKKLYERFPSIEKVALQQGAFPGMKFKGCRTAFVFAKIFPNGDVQLCHKEIVGNINKQNFVEIWFGEAAYNFRRRLMATTDACRKCTCWLFCINQHNMDTDDIHSHLGGTFRYPCLVEEGYRGFNIVSLKGRFYGLAQGEGKLDLNKVNTNDYRCVVADSIGEVKQLIDESLASPEREDRRLIEEGYGDFNIIHHKDRFYGLAQAEGRLELSKVGTGGYRCVVGETPEEVKRLIDKLGIPAETRQ